MLEIRRAAIAFDEEELLELEWLIMDGGFGWLLSFFYIPNRLGSHRDN